MKLKDIAKKIETNKKIVYEAEQGNRSLIDQMIVDHGNVMKEDKFWMMCGKIKEGIDKRTDNGFLYENAIHSLFTDAYHTVDVERVEYQDFLDFAHTYSKVVSIVANDDTIWKHASQYEYMSDDGWHDFTDFLPIMGKEVYEHVLTKGSEVMPDGTKPWNRNHEAYIETTLRKKIGVWANEALTDEEEEELWV